MSGALHLTPAGERGRTGGYPWRSRKLMMIWGGLCFAAVVGTISQAGFSVQRSVFKTLIGYAHYLYNLYIVFSIPEH
jgi:hypothetical protein